MLGAAAALPFALNIDQRLVSSEGRSDSARERIGQRVLWRDSVGLGQPAMACVNELINRL